MKGIIINDWSIVKNELGTQKGWEKFVGAFQYFFSALDKVKELKAAYQAFTTKGDFPAEVLAVLEKFHATGDFDLGYEQIFDIRDYTGSEVSGFEIVDVTSGLAFKRILSGEKAEVYKMSGSKVSVNFDLYGGALGWEKTWFDDNKFWTIEDTAIEFRNKAYMARAAAFYALIEALPSTTDIAWQPLTPTSSALPNSDANYVASRDVNTIQKACDEILESLKNSGMAVTANTPLKAVVPNVLKPRFNRALTLLNQPVTGSDKQLTYNVTPVYTLMLNNNTDYYVAVPGKKLKGGYRQDLTMLAHTDILAYVDTTAGWMRHGGAIGDTRQLRRCKTSA